MSLALLTPPPLCKTDLAAHLPDYATFEGIIDLFHIFVIADMGAILYAPRYGDNVVNYSDRHRKSFIQCRALAHQILKYLQSSHLLKSASNQLVKMSAVYLSFLVEQVQSFWLQQTKIQPSPNKPDHVDAVAVAIARCFHGKEQFWKCWARFDHLKNPPSPRYGFHGKPYAVAPPIHCMQVGSYFTKRESPHSTTTAILLIHSHSQNFLTQRGRRPLKRRRRMTTKSLQKYDSVSQRSRSGLKLDKRSLRENKISLPSRKRHSSSRPTLVLTTKWSSIREYPDFY